VSHEDLSTAPVTTTTTSLVRFKSPNPSVQKILKAQSVFHVLSDLNSIAGGALFLYTGANRDFTYLSPAASALIASFAIEFFRNADLKIELIKKDPQSARALCTMADSFGHTLNITGLSMLVGGANITASSWILTSGTLIKAAAFATMLAKFGIDGTYGNDHTVTNAIFRVAIAGVGGTIGGILFTIANTIHSPEILIIGSYTIGLASILGTSEVLVRDVQALIEIFKVTQSH
jgi:hypothetical protein